MLRVLDLFCCAGGMGTGLHRAGFEIVGVDSEPQPRYPFEFVMADALAVLAGAAPVELGGFVAIHASPPCQRYSPLARMHPERDYPDLVLSVRRLLKATRLPYIIENVPGAPLFRPTLLCGSMFGLGTTTGRYLRRHRLFETNWPLPSPGDCRHTGMAVGVYGKGSGQAKRSALNMSPRGGYQGNAVERREAMGIDWMRDHELSEAIPPAYGEWVGRHLLGWLNGNG